MAKASSRRSRFEVPQMAKALHSPYSAMRIGQVEIALKNPWRLALFMAGLFASMGLTTTALLLQI
jgi:hypothetical protein